MAYPTYRNLPPLAGLCSMEEAQQSQWSVEKSVTRLKRLHYMLRRLHNAFTARLTAEPIYELKTAFSHHAYVCAEHVTAIRKRVSEMRQPPLGLDETPHGALERFFDELQAAPDTTHLVAGLYGVAVPALIADCQSLMRAAHPLADAPTVRLAKFAEFELRDVDRFGREAIACLVEAERPASGVPENDVDEWLDLLQAYLRASEQEPDEAELPAPKYSAEPYQYDRIPRRDERFIDSYNAGVNPEAFLYDPRFSSRDKTLMMFYKRLRELDVPEMMASILHEMPGQPWEFYREMTRQLWDEARHAMMGEVGFAHLDIDWRQVPINFTWSLNLNTQLTPQERHGVLFFIEQGLMPKTGKRYEWEVGLASEDALSALFQDFDWADEVLHSQIGRRWYVPQFASLGEAMDYGDRCWSKVLSHWRDYRDQGLTDHRNWWPELYRTACERWRVTPDPDALAYDVTYEETRADLRTINPEAPTERHQ